MPASCKLRMTFNIYFRYKLPPPKHHVTLSRRGCPWRDAFLWQLLGLTASHLEVGTKSTSMKVGLSRLLGAGGGVGGADFLGGGNRPT